MAADGTARRPAHQAVEAALRHIAEVDATTTADAMLRTFLAFKHIWHAHDGEEDFRPSTPDVDKVAAELTQLRSGDGSFKGSIALRGEKGHVRWMRNDTGRSSIVTYGRPGEKGNALFEEADDGQRQWWEPLRDDAAELVAGTQLKRKKPARDALAAIFLRDAAVDPSWGWGEMVEEMRSRLGLTQQELELVTGDPVLGDVDPFDGDEWDAQALSADVLPADEDSTDDPVDEDPDDDGPAGDIPPLVAAQVARVVAALKRHGRSKFVALVGVPGTSKSHVARLAGREFATDADCISEVQFSPSYTYEQFMQGMRFESAGTAAAFPGSFLEINQRALDHPDKQFVLRIDEFSRADLTRVLGELLTYVEYRGEDDQFLAMYDRKERVRVAPNLGILVTYNPADLSAVTMDGATLRRIRKLRFPPDMGLLEEMLARNGLPAPAIAQLRAMFDACREQAGERFQDEMPFGHAVFNEVHTEEDLYELWHEELRDMLVRPRTPEHELYRTIRDSFPWHAEPQVTVAPTTPSGAGVDAGTEAPVTSDAPGEGAATDEPAHATGATEQPLEEP